MPKITRHPPIKEVIISFRPMTYKFKFLIIFCIIQDRQILTKCFPKMLYCIFCFQKYSKQSTQPIACCKGILLLLLLLVQILYMFLPKIFYIFCSQYIWFMYVCWFWLIFNYLFLRTVIKGHNTAFFGTFVTTLFLMKNICTLWICN